MRNCKADLVTQNVIKSRRFTPEDQTAFAELSGDHNPMHVDAVVARRLLGGAQVVHGIHSLLWALDSWLGGQAGAVQLHSIQAEFSKALRVGEEARISLKQIANQQVKAEITSCDSVLATIEWRWELWNPSPDYALDERSPEKREPSVLSVDEIEARSGSLELRFAPQAAAKMFECLTTRIPPAQIALLLATSRLIGMECPGLHSVFSELSLAASRSHESSSLDYSVTKVHRRFGMVLMKVGAPGFVGELKAFVRPKPQAQIDYLQAKQQVEASEFASQQALVVGGSRGLGEVTAKLLAAGGARVIITYHQGQLEARRIVEEIVSNGGTASAVRLDVSATSEPALHPSLLKDRPTHLYYFATPFIQPGTKGQFSADIFRRFCDYYVTGFLNVMNLLTDYGVRKVFYPSSVFVDEVPPDMGEYAAAKMAAEVLCLTLEKNHQAPVTVYKPRLPRMATDQTLSLYPVLKQDPAPIMLKHVRTFRDM